MRMFHLSDRLVQRESEKPKSKAERETRSIIDFQSTIVYLFEQGDEEKRRGIQPQSLMDRSLAHELPKNQVGNGTRPITHPPAVL
jgi:hypothetical protein